jgi:plastocyanin
MPAYYPPPSYMRPVRPVVEVGAYDKVGFKPKDITVAPGTTVRWVNQGKHPHTVTANDGRWDSGDIPPGGSYAATFQQPGTYYYYCRHHTNERMQGAIVVGAGGDLTGRTPPSRADSMPEAVSHTTEPSPQTHGARASHPAASSFATCRRTTR